MSLVTQLAYQVWRDGRCQPRADDTLLKSDLLVITTAEIDRREAAALLRRLALVLEGRT